MRRVSDYEKRAEKSARDAGWYINQDGDFATCVGTDIEDTIDTISPTDIGAWGTLCYMEGIEVT